MVRFSVWLVSCYARVFVLAVLAILTVFLLLTFSVLFSLCNAVMKHFHLHHAKRNHNDELTWHFVLAKWLSRTWRHPLSVIGREAVIFPVLCLVKVQTSSTTPDLLLIPENLFCRINVTFWVAELFCTVTLCFKFGQHWASVYCFCACSFQRAFARLSVPRWISSSYKQFAWKWRLIATSREFWCDSRFNRVIL